MIIHFDQNEIDVQPDVHHEWLLTTAQVADGYAVTEGAIRMQKQRNPDELVEGKHYISVTNRDSFNNQAVMMWTKRGVVRLGFMITSPQAKRFRDFAEDLVVNQVSGLALPKNLVDALRLYAGEIEAREAIEKELSVARPKAEFFDAVTDSEDTADLGTVAKLLNMPGIGRTKLFARLREAGILMSNNRPYQAYQDRGWFRVIETSWSKPDGSQHVYFKTVVFQKGIDGIRKLMNKTNLPVLC